jgi:hypothetical protein
MKTKNLELTNQELSLLLDSVNSRMRQIDKLLTCFEDPKLIVLYSKDRIELDKLETKLISL